MSNGQKSRVRTRLQSLARSAERLSAKQDLRKAAQTCNDDGLDEDGGEFNMLDVLCVPSPQPMQ